MPVAEVELDLFRQELEIITRLVHQGCQSVRGLQDFTRIRKDRPVTTVSLNDVVREAVELTRHYWKKGAEAKGHGVEVRLALGETQPVRGVDTELIQVVSNLIFNSTEAMPDGGVIEIRTRQEGEWIALDVSDTGIGMSSEEQSRVFEPFFTTKEKGHGLGSSVLYGIVIRHGGEIKVESSLGAGTCFKIRLPAGVESGETETDAKPAGRGLAADGRAAIRVLVVDDDDADAGGPSHRAAGRRIHRRRGRRRAGGREAVRELAVPRRGDRPGHAGDVRVGCREAREGAASPGEGHLAQWLGSPGEPGGGARGGNRPGSLETVSPG